MFTGPKERANYLERIEGAVDDGRHVVYLCGETVYKYLGVNNDNKEIQIWKTKKGKNYFVVFGAHPSWHLVSGGRHASRMQFKRDMSIVKVLSKMSPDDALQLTPEALNTNINFKLDILTQEYFNGTKLVQDKLLGGDRVLGKFWPHDLKHLRLQDWGNENIVEKFFHFIDGVDNPRQLLKFHAIPNGILDNKIEDVITIITFFLLS